MSENRPSFFRRLLRFRLGSLLAAVAAVAVVCGLYQFYERKAHERAVVAELELLHCEVYYDCQFDSDGGFKDPLSPPPGPAWLRAILGDDVCGSPTVVELRYPGFNLDTNALRDERIRFLKQLPTLRMVWRGFFDEPTSYQQALPGVTVLSAGISGDSP